MAAKKNSKAKKEDYDPNAPHEAGMKIDVKDGNDHQMSKDFTVERITAATMVTLACNTVAQAPRKGPPLGTPPSACATRPSGT